MIDLAIFETEPAKTYHEKAKDYLSSHQLIDFMKCPYGYYKKRMSQTQTNSEAFTVGTAAHALILEGREKYENEFAVGGPVNPQTGKPFGPQTNKFKEWQATQNKPVISTAQAEIIEMMAKGVEANDEANKLLASGRAEAVLRANFFNCPCQIRIDWVNPEMGIVDLKTCDDLDWFSADAKKYHYHHQLAFYQSVLKEATDSFYPVYVIAVEKQEPFRAGVFMFVQETLDAARAENRAAIGRYLISQKTNVWPTNYESIRFLSYK